MELVNPEYQSVNYLYASKEVEISWFPISVNTVAGLSLFRDWYIPQRAISQSNFF